MTTIWTILRTGSLHTAAHVDLIRRQLAKVAPGVRLNCLSDRWPGEVNANVTSMRFRWPGTWERMELMTHGGDDDMLFIDLDSIIVGDIAEILAAPGCIALFDAQTDDINTSLLKLTGDARAALYARWIRKPDSWKLEYKARAERGFLFDVLGGDLTTWDQALPGQVAVYRTDMYDQGIRTPPAGTRIVCTMGKPPVTKIMENWVREASRAPAGAS